MNEYIELISQLKPKNNGNFPIADVNDLKGGYIQVDTIAEMQTFLYTNKLKEGMLCYVKTDITNQHMYQYLNTIWQPWAYSGSGGSGGFSIQMVVSLDDLNNPELERTGQLVFVQEVDSLRYYNGTVWKSFSKIYIQNTPPADTGGIWIDTSEDREYTSASSVIQNLLQIIGVLYEKIDKLEYAFNNQMDFGDFSNNQASEYDGTTPLEPVLDASYEEDTAQQSQDLLDTVLSDVEPTQYKTMIPNAKHLCVKSGTEKQMKDHAEDFLPKELLFCYDTGSLYIKHPTTFKLVKIGSSSTDVPDIDDTMKQILTSTFNGIEKITGIEFADMANTSKTYLAQVINGELKLKDYSLDVKNLAGNVQTTTAVANYYSSPYFPISSTNIGSTVSPRIFIHSIFTGGENGARDFASCSHNFVELCNMTPVDLNLKGLYLHYTKPVDGMTIQKWVTLPLRGIIKAESTFLIRGAQCAYEDVNTTVLKVKTYDMEWTKSATYNSAVLDITEDLVNGVAGQTIWDSDDYIKFNANCSFYLSAAEDTDTTLFYSNPLNVLTTSTPYDSTNKSCLKWYIDLIGIGAGMPAEVTALGSMGTSASNYIYTRVFAMDPGKSAIKAFIDRKNSTEWTIVSLTNPPSQYNIQDFTPKASWEGKNFFFNKDLLTEGAPSIVTCNFGYNAHTTRCFNWVSKGYYDEYLEIVIDGNNYTETLGVDKFESFKVGDNRASTNNRNNTIYNRIRAISNDGTAFTVHKFIKDFSEPTEGTTVKYKYRVGRPGAWSKDRYFTLRNRADVITNGHNFLHITDEQGNTEEEYQTTRLTTEFIKQDSITNNYSYDFIVQTGDIAQNGNRFNEWIDYFNNRELIFNDKEVMFTVGNNDLSPVDLSTFGRGEDWDKTSPQNVNFFFTFEHPFTIPKSSTGVYIPSIYSFFYGDTYYLSMNSEITTAAVTSVFSQDATENIYSQTIKAWCDNEMLNLPTNPGIIWKVAFNHEGPFTLVVVDDIYSFVDTSNNINNSQARNGSHLNTVGNYWFSHFLEDNKFSLNLCGHKHTFTNSRYIRENSDPLLTMQPVVYDPSPETATWYSNLDARYKPCCTLSSDTNQWYVKYVMNQSTGYKVASNKESPSPQIPWLLEYYPVTITNATTTPITTTVNSGQKFPHYILWNVGVGTETEVPGIDTSIRPRIKGNVYRILTIGSSTTWPTFKLSSPITISSLYRDGGNGATNKDNNIIVEKLFT